MSPERQICVTFQEMAGAIHVALRNHTFRANNEGLNLDHGVIAEYPKALQRRRSVERVDNCCGRVRPNPSFNKPAMYQLQTKTEPGTR